MQVNLLQVEITTKEKKKRANGENKRNETAHKHQAMTFTANLLCMHHATVHLYIIHLYIFSVYSLGAEKNKNVLNTHVARLTSEIIGFRSTQ